MSLTKETLDESQAAVKEGPQTTCCDPPSLADTKQLGGGEWASSVNSNSDGGLFLTRHNGEDAGEKSLSPSCACRLIQWISHRFFTRGHTLNSLQILFFSL